MHLQGQCRAVLCAAVLLCLLCPMTPCVEPHGPCSCAGSEWHTVMLTRYVSKYRSRTSIPDLDPIKAMCLARRYNNVQKICLLSVVHLEDLSPLLRLLILSGEQTLLILSKLDSD
ncbi:uncharacterized protein MEPE_00946 [Melanopsichium pennsylvanicum]|uniref:Secreted protein n=1 Tax=Melanopsichium pennsylvanicum TaxID=63383 RepID=A0AAJ4XHJ7_9BASI|nr:uncharacterized protein MEPE_00946 [Melanopsichium pennsylvanicum]